MAIKLNRQLIEAAIAGSKRPEDARKLWLSIEDAINQGNSPSSSTTTSTPASSPVSSTTSAPSSSSSGSSSSGNGQSTTTIIQVETLPKLASDPISPTVGYAWYNTTTNQAKLYDGTGIRVIAELANTLDQFAAPAADLSIGNFKLVNVADPTSAQDAATKAYVDAVPIPLAGAGAPAAGLGVNGDFYLNLTNGRWYQKSAGAWASLNLSAVGKGAIIGGANVTVTDNGDGTTTLAASGGGIDLTGFAVASGGENTITLDTAPYAKTVRVFVNGAIVAGTLSGSMITLSSSLSAGDVVVVKWIASTQVPPQHVTLSGSLAPALRGTGQLTQSASSFVIPFPAGSQAGDLAVVMVGHGWAANTPSGWTSNNNTTGSNWNGAVFSKILSSGDISTGSVTVTFAGSFDGYAAIAVFVGGTAGIRETDALRGSSNGASQIGPSTSSGVLTTDSLLYFGSARAGGSPTCTLGTLQRQGNDGSAASGALYFQQGSASGVITPTFNYTAGSGYYQAVVVVKGI